MKTIARALKSETAYPAFILTQCLISFMVMGLANYAREAAPAWHLPMSIFLVMMSGLALRDLRKARQAARVRAGTPSHRS